MHNFSPHVVLKQPGQALTANENVLEIHENLGEKLKIRRRSFLNAKEKRWWGGGAGSSGADLMISQAVSVFTSWSWPGQVYVKTQEIFPGVSRWIQEEGFGWDHFR